MHGKTFDALLFPRLTTGRVVYCLLFVSVLGAADFVDRECRHTTADEKQLETAVHVLVWHGNFP